VLRLARFARAALDEEHPSDAAVMAERDPDLYWAYQLHRQEEPGRRADVESRIIGGEDDDTIAAKTGIPAEVVATYSHSFYDVREKLKYPGYVLHTLIGTALHRGLQERDYFVTWKYLAFTYGIHVFEAFLKQAIHATKPRDASGVRACLQDAGFSSLLRKQMLAATAIPVNQFTMPQILEVYAKFVEIDRKAGTDGAAASNTLLNNVQAVLNVLQLDIGIYAKPNIDAHALNDYDSGSAELPTRQLILAAQNRLGEAAGIPQNLKYPEPVNHARIESTS
jgi:hypothetical protein